MPPLSLVTRNTASGIPTSNAISDTLDVWFDSGTTHWHVLRGLRSSVGERAASVRPDGDELCT